MWFRMAENWGLFKGKPILVEIPMWPHILWESHWVVEPMYLAVQQGQENIYTTLEVRSNGLSFFSFSSDESVKSLENTILISNWGKSYFSAFKSCFLITKLKWPTKGILKYRTSFLTVVSGTGGENLLFLKIQNHPTFLVIKCGLNFL